MYLEFVGFFWFVHQKHLLQGGQCRLHRRDREDMYQFETLYQDCQSLARHRRSYNFANSFPNHSSNGGSGTQLRGRAFAHGAMGRRIDPSWGGPIELFLVPASAPRLV